MKWERPGTSLSVNRDSDMQSINQIPTFNKVRARGVDSYISTREAMGFRQVWTCILVLYLQNHLMEVCMYEQVSNGSMTEQLHWNDPYKKVLNYCMKNQKLLIAVTVGWKVAQQPKWQWKLTCIFLFLFDDFASFQAILFWHTKCN